MELSQLLFLCEILIKGIFFNPEILTHFIFFLLASSFQWRFEMPSILNCFTVKDICIKWKNSYTCIYQKHKTFPPCTFDSKIFQGWSFKLKCNSFPNIKSMSTNIDAPTQFVCISFAVHSIRLQNQLGKCKFVQWKSFNIMVNEWKLFNEVANKIVATQMSDISLENWNWIKLQINGSKGLYCLHGRPWC